VKESGLDNTGEEKGCLWKDALKKVGKVASGKKKVPEFGEKAVCICDSIEETNWCDVG